MKKYTDTHNWIELDGDIGTVGITDFAQKELGEIVYIELPKTEHFVKAGEEAVVIESTKAAIDIYAPLSGEIIEINRALRDFPEAINTSPEKEGWLFKIKITDPKETLSLLSETDYATLVNN